MAAAVKAGKGFFSVLMLPDGDRWLFFSEQILFCGGAKSYLSRPGPADGAIIPQSKTMLERKLKVKVSFYWGSGR